MVETNGEAGDGWIKVQIEAEHGAVTRVVIAGEEFVPRTPRQEAPMSRLGTSEWEIAFTYKIPVP